MTTEKIELKQIKINTANPRYIKDEKFTQLINSILVFPKMLELRPIVVDDTMTILGGNMRYRALCAISEYSTEELSDKLNECNDYRKKAKEEQLLLTDYWRTWIDSPTLVVIKSSELTSQQQREFIIKDNVGFGEWDMDMLANEWDIEDLKNWGCDLNFNLFEELSEDELDEEREDKDFIAKITFNDEATCKRFIADYEEKLKDEYKCIISYTGGKL